MPNIDNNLFNNFKLYNSKFLRYCVWKQITYGFSMKLQSNIGDT